MHSLSQLVAGVGFLALATAVNAQSTPRPARTDRATDVYAALLAEAAGELHAPVWIEARSARYAPLGLGAWLPIRRQQDSLPPGLVERLRAVAARPGDARRLPLPREVRIVSPTRSRQLQAQGHGGTVVYALSPVAFSADSTDALVYVERHCGALCGNGRAVWLVRASDGRWTVRGEVLHYAS